MGRSAATVGRRAVLRAGAGLAMVPLARALRARAATAPDVEAEVGIVGSGPAGAILACALARRGVPVLLIESGPRSDAPRDPRLAELDIYDAAGPVPYPLAASRFRGAGGTTNLWSGTCPRLHPSDFDPHPYTPAGAPWPIDYAELEPYYLPAEVELAVRGVDGAPHAPPRRAPFPRQIGAAAPNLDELTRRRGVELALHWLPRSTGDGGPIRIAASHLPELEASPNATLVSDATVTRIEGGAGGRIEGLRLERLDGPPRMARARAYVLACGGVESARLLLLSALGDRSGQLGRNFMEHPLVALGTGTVDADFPTSPYAEWLCTEEFVDPARRRGLGGLRIRVVAEPRKEPPRRLAIAVRAEIETAPSPANRIGLGARRDAFGNPGAQLTLSFTDADRRTMAYGEMLVWQTLNALGVADPRVEAGFLRWGHHHIGTCRMGDDPTTSVVDRHLRVHGTDNLYVAGSAPFVTSGISNPTLTIAALSLRLADHLAEQWRT